MSKEAIDAKWIGRFEKSFILVDVEKSLEIDFEQMGKVKETFLRGKVINPNFEYSNIDLDELNNAEEEFLRLKEDIIMSEENEALKATYRWRLNEMIARVRMLKAAKNGDMRRFTRYSKFIYGSPSPELFDLSVYDIRKHFKKNMGGEDGETARTMEELDSLLPRPKSNPNLPKSPSKDTVQAVYDIVNKEYEKLELEVDPEREYTDQEIKELFEIALLKVGATDWVVRINKNRTSINVSQPGKNVSVPEGKTYKGNLLIKRVMHEIKRHVERRVKGETSQLSLLGFGLDRYEKGEEGVTKVTEHAVSNKFLEFATPELHLGIGLALGLDGEKKDFRQVYEILEKHFYLKEMRAKNPKSKEEAVITAQEKAWKHCYRIFRGTDCSTPGACLTKDIIYREGAVGVWYLVIKDTNEVYKFSIGKYDPTNERHLWILSQLEITDEALSSLES